MEKDINQKLDEVIRLLAVFLKRGTQQTTLIKELSDVGFQPKRISELLGTTSNTVRVGLHSLKKFNKAKGIKK